MIKNRALLFVVSSNFIHKLTENIYDLVLPLLILYFTNSPILMGVCYALGFLADFLAAYFGGAVIDSYNRKKVLIFISISQAFLISFIPIFHEFQILTAPLVLFIAFFIDLLIAMYGLTDISIIPEIVKKSDLPSANSFSQIALSIATSIGPSIAGLSLTIFGLFNSLWFTFSGFLILIFSLRLINYSDKEITAAATPKKILRKSFEGLKYTLSIKVYKLLTLWNLFINLGLTGAVLMIMFKLKEELHITETQIGFIYTLSAAGGIISGLILPYVHRFFKSAHALFISSFMTALSLLILAHSDHWLTIGILNSILMGSIGLNSRLVSLLFQTHVPADYLGRVFSGSRLISTLLAPLSVLAAGYFSHKLGTLHVFQAGSFIIILTNIVFLFTSLRHEDWRLLKEESDVKNEKLV